MIERPGFLPPSVCAELVGAFEALHPLHGAEVPPGGDQDVLHYGALPYARGRIDPHGRLVPGDDAASRIRSLLNGLRARTPALVGDARRLFPELTLVCRTREGGAMEPHEDRAWRSATAVIYLNDGFDGGETRFTDGRAVRPETGKLIYFDGASLRHEVAKVSGGPRYTVSLWWSEDPARLEA